MGLQRLAVCSTRGQSVFCCALLKMLLLYYIVDPISCCCCCYCRWQGCVPKWLSVRPPNSPKTQWVNWWQGGGLMVLYSTYKTVLRQCVSTCIDSTSALQRSFVRRHLIVGYSAGSRTCYVIDMTIKCSIINLSISCCVAKETIDR